MQNYPNPFNPTTTINFSIASNGKNEILNTKLTVYNSLGQEVEVLVNEALGSGNYSVKFNGTNLSTGIYFYKISSGVFSNVKKMILIK